MKNHKLGYTVGVLVVGALVVGYTHVLRAQYGGTNTSANDTSNTSNMSTTPSASEPSNTTDMGTQNTNASATGGMSDKDLADKVKSALKDDQTLSSSARHVRVKADNGKVVLKGSVKSEQDKDSIAAKAGEIAGVGNVEDDIVVR